MAGVYSGGLRGRMKIKELEDGFQKAIIELFELHGWRVYHVARVKGHLRSKTGVGFLDLCMARKHQIIFAELKSETGVVSDDQHEWIDVLETVSKHSNMVNVFVWRPEHWSAIERIAI